MNLPAAEIDAGARGDDQSRTAVGIPKPPEVVDIRPFGWRHRLAWLVWILAADWLLYRGEGYAGVAVFALAVPPLLLLGSWRPSPSTATIGLSAGLLLIGGRMLWQGDDGIVLSAVVLTLALALSLAGGSPAVLETLAFMGNVIRGAARRLARYRLFGRHKSEDAAEGTDKRAGTRFALLLPLLVGLLFAAIFVLANPDVVTLVSTRVQQWANTFADWVFSFSPWQIVFWIVSGWIGLGLLRPALPLPRWTATDPAIASPPIESSWFAPLRNTLFTAIILFGVYLAFEFSTLWFRTLPEGFYYAGYAHQGAAWLTVALALATAILSLAFRGTILRERRFPGLRRLAWTWSALNLLLAISVYNRLLIYIGFNGMTRMRVVGLLGITAVVIGFLLVVYKIAQTKSFLWLIRYQLLTVALLAIAYAVAPVDWIAHRYNVAAVQAGNPRPAVQIAVKPIDNEGAFALFPLLDADDPAIRRGIRAVLAKRHRLVNRRVIEQRNDWTRYQAADHLLLRRLKSLPEEQRLTALSPQELEERLERFWRYTEPWY